MDLLIIVALGLSAALCVVAFLIATNTPQKVADQYRLATCGRDKTVAWSGSTTPAIVTEAMALQAAIIKTWPLAVTIAPALQSLQGPRQIRFAMHEAMLAEMYGIDKRTRFKEVYLGLSWIEWNEHLHTALLSRAGDDATTVADDMATSVWNHVKDDIPVLEEPHKALAELTSTRFLTTETTH